MTKHVIQERVRVESIPASHGGKATENRPILRFSISEDLIDQLFQFHDELYKVYFVYQDARSTKEQRYARHRIEFARLADIRLPAVLMRVEPPTYDPHGQRFSRAAGSRQYRCQIAARKLRVRNDITTKDLELIVAPNMRGIYCTFPDEDMIFEGEKLSARQKLIPINDQDMAVR